MYAEGRAAGSALSGLVISIIEWTKTGFGMAELYECVFTRDVSGDALHEAGRGIKFRTKTIKSGPVLEVEVFPIWQTRSEARAARRSVTRDAQRAVNERNARKRLDRLMNCNFGSEDLCVTLTYAGEAPDQEQAAKDVRNYLRRVKYWRKKHGLSELKYIYVIEWEPEADEVVPDAEQLCFEGMQGSFLAPVKVKRIHHHVVMSGMDRDEAERLWKKGRVNSRRLQPDDFGLHDLAGYMVKAPRTCKRWYGSRNLAEPKVTVSDHKFSRRQVMAMAERFGDEGAAVLRKVYAGYESVGEPVIRGSEFVSGFYFYARMIRAGVRFKGGG